MMKTIRANGREKSIARSILDVRNLRNDRKFQESICAVSDHFCQMIEIP